MKPIHVLGVSILLILCSIMNLQAMTSLSVSQRVGDFRKMNEADLVTSIRKAFDQKIGETMVQKNCQNIGKKWSLAFPRLEKMSPKQLDEELKDMQIDESSRGCLTDEQEIIVLLKGLTIAKKNELTVAQDKLSRLFEGESAVNSVD